VSEESTQGAVRGPSASWLNQTETWFGILSSQAIRRGSFRSVKTADQVLPKAVRKPSAIGESGR